MTPRVGLCDICGNVDILGLIACEDVYACPNCAGVRLGVASEGIRMMLASAPQNLATDEIVGFYAHDKAALDNYIVSCGPALVISQLIDPEHRAFYVHMPCGYQKAYYKYGDIPATSVSCDCGWPNHWFLKYRREPAEVQT